MSINGRLRDGAEGGESISEVELSSEAKGGGFRDRRMTFRWSGSGEGRGALDDVLLSGPRRQGDHRGDV